MPFTLARYFGIRFLIAVIAVFSGVFVLVVLVDYVELMRRASDIPDVSAWLVAKTSFFRVPQVTERLLPFAVLVGAMTCYLNLSRRLELVIARSAGISAWQFVAPAAIGALLLGVAATTVYNPLSAAMLERSKRLEADLFGEHDSGLQSSAAGFLGPPEERGRSVDRERPVKSRAGRGTGRGDSLYVRLFWPFPRAY